MRTLCFVTLVLLVLIVGPVAIAECPSFTCAMAPELHPIDWWPWLADLKSWRNYDPAKIAGIGRLVPSLNGAVQGELLNEQTCQVLAPGKYIFAMKYQNNETDADYIQNSEVLYRLTEGGVGSNYIRHSQLAAGFPVYCAGEFLIKPLSGSQRLTLLNELVEVNNFSGHYKPKCKCLGVLLEKLEALKVNTCSTEVKFMDAVQNCR